MPNKKIQLNFALSDDLIDRLIENHIQPTAEDYDVLIDEPATLLKPDGSTLLKLIRGFIPTVHVKEAFGAFHDRLTPKKNSQREAISRSANAGSEGVLGYMDRVYRFNYCRTTALTNKHLVEYQAALPMIQTAGEAFRLSMPARYAAQIEFCNATEQEYVIPFTPFTTVTMNRDVTAVYHKDAGDLKTGFGVIAATWAGRSGAEWTVVSENSAEGGYLVFPKYRVAVKVKTGDVLLCDVHEAHGVTAIVGEPKTWARMSFVFYCREHMNVCATQSEEAKRVSIADTLSYE